MAYYRVYFINQRSGHFERFAEFDAAGDGEAIEHAGTYESDQAVELWCGGRMVCRLEARPALGRTPTVT
jgi:hypothetical protein